MRNIPYKLDLQVTLTVCFSFILKENFVSQTNVVSVLSASFALKGPRAGPMYRVSVFGYPNVSAVPGF